MKTHAHQLARRLRRRAQSRRGAPIVSRRVGGATRMTSARVGPVGRKRATVIRPMQAVAGRPDSFFERPPRFFERAIEARGGSVGQNPIRERFVAERPRVYRRVFVVVAPGGRRRRGSTGFTRAQVGVRARLRRR